MWNPTTTYLLIVPHILYNDRVHFVNVAGEVEYLIYPNGKMSIYFVSIPVEFNATVLESWIDYRHRCIDNKMNKSIFEPYNRINTPVHFIKQHTLVEFEPNTERCYIKDLKETWLSASKVNKTCHWCSKVNKCTNGLDTHADHWIAKECHTA
ncbi:unnamed protein product, partial [Schistosoma curassoni]|uniref:Egg protein n=1 Tax=Schistosoma curassoni TaxID=6186 RepID=A0A183L206_9TREM